MDNCLCALRQECEVVAGSDFLRACRLAAGLLEAAGGGVECRLRCHDRLLQEWTARSTALQPRYWCDWGG